MASLTQWTWVWVDSRSWRRGRTGVLWFMGPRRVGHDWATKLNWTELNQVRRHLINLLNEHESIFSFLSTSDFSISLVQTSAASVPWKCGGRSKRKLAPFPLYFLSLGSTSNALKLRNYKKMGNATEKKAVDLVWFRALAIRLVSRIIMTQNAEISIQSGRKCVRGVWPEMNAHA